MRSPTFRRYVWSTLLFPVKTFALATLYAFLSAILVGLALNLFAGILLNENVPCSKMIAVRTACAFFLLASLFFFFVSWLLEIARNDWLAEGAPRDLAKRDFHFESRRIRLLGCFTLGVLCTALGCASLFSSSPISLIFEILFCTVPSLRK